MIQTVRLTDLETNLWLERMGEGWREDTALEFGMDMYTLLYLKLRTTNKDLWYSTWNSAQCYVPAWRGRGLEENGYMYIYGWLHLILSLFTVQLTLSRHCESAKPQHKKKNFLKLIFSAISSVQSLSCVWLFATPWTAAHQASLSITNSRSLFNLMSIK